MNVSQTFVAKGMTTGQGSGIKRERRKKDRTRKPTENRPVPGEREVVKPKCSRRLTSTVFQTHTDWLESTSISLNVGTCCCLGRGAHGME
jgi:hypothetical protein